MGTGADWVTDGGGLDDVGVLGGASAFVLLVVVEDCGVVEDVAGGAGVDADDREVAAADGVLDVEELPVRVVDDVGLRDS